MGAAPLAVCMYACCTVLFPNAPTTPCLSSKPFASSRYKETHVRCILGRSGLCMPLLHARDCSVAVRHQRKPTHMLRLRVATATAGQETSKQDMGQKEETPTKVFALNLPAPSLNLPAPAQPYLNCNCCHSPTLSAPTAATPNHRHPTQVGVLFTHNPTTMQLHDLNAPPTPCVRGSHTPRSNCHTHQRVSAAPSRPNPPTAPPTPAPGSTRDSWCRSAPTEHAVILFCSRQDR